MPRPYAILDVFTARRFAGNPLGVVRDGSGLSTEAMQSIAREFNLPETVFLFAPDDKAHRARLRIFTPVAELPFAGHPTVGTAVLLGLETPGPGAFILKEQIGEVPCRVQQRGPDHGYAEFDLPRLPKRIADAADAEILAASLGLSLDDLGCEDFAPGIWSAGAPFTLVPVRGLDAMARARSVSEAWREGVPKHIGIFLFCRETAENGHAFHARMFAPAMGIPEDPATGGALAAFAGLIAESAGLKDGTHKLPVEQGYEMGRPSIMHLTITLDGSALTSATIGGDAIVVARGEFLA